ncbi:ParB/Srx family N-terminal domain-containing protein [Enterobacter hormaechei]
MTEKLKIVYRPLKDLTPYTRNARTHDDRQVLQLVASIEEFGWTNPILIDEQGEIVAGHGRVLAAEQMGIASIPTITLSGLTDAQKAAYRIADNRLPLNAGWNGELLKLEIEALQDVEFDIGLLGFSELELGDVLGVEPDDPSDHWVGMPAFDQENNNGVRQLIVHFETDADVALFAQLVQQQITAKTKYIWYPEHKRESTVNKAYISDES